MKKLIIIFLIFISSSSLIGKEYLICDYGAIVKGEVKNTLEIPDFNNSTILSVASNLKSRKDSFTFNATDYNIKEYGAIGDSKTMNTTSIQKAINEAYRQGGGKVVVPKGIFLTGTIRLKSNIELILEEGAMLLGSTNWSDYERNERCLALILADKSTNVKITGKGIIDGQGLLLIDDIKKKISEGIIKNSVHRNRPDWKIRPHLIEFTNCEKVHIQNITLLNGSGWTQIYKNCNNVLVDSVKVRCFSYWETDGIDLIDCKNGKLIALDIKSEDDGICLKSDDPKSACENIEILDCKVSSGSSAFKFGTASFGGFKNIKVNHLTIYDTYRSALAFFLVDGGVIENIDIQNVVVTNTVGSICIRLGHRNQKVPTGRIDGIHFKNIDMQVRADGKKINPYQIRIDLPPVSEKGKPYNPLPSMIIGTPDYPVKNISFENVSIKYYGNSSKEIANVPIDSLGNVPENLKNYPEFDKFGELPASAFYIRHAKDLYFNNVKVSFLGNEFRPSFVFDDAKKLQMKRIEIDAIGKATQFVLNNSSNLKLKVATEKVKTLNNCAEVSF